MCERYPDCPVIMTDETGLVLGLLHRHYGCPIEPVLQRQVILLPADGAPFAIEGVKIRFFPAGHVLGGAMVELDTEFGQILVSGDVSWHEVGGVPPAAILEGRFDLICLAAPLVSVAGSRID